MTMRSMRENIDWNCGIGQTCEGNTKNGGLNLPVTPVWEDRKTVGRGQYFSVLPSKTDSKVLVLADQNS